MRRVTIVCADIVGRKMAGPAIRAVELCRALAGRFSTTLVSRSAGDGYAREGNFTLVEANAASVRAAAADSDIVIVQGDVLNRWPVLRKTSAVLIADLYCPIPLELIETASDLDIAQRWPMNEVAAMQLIDQILHADHFLCASERQLDLWMGALTVLNRVNPIRFPRASSSAVTDLFTIVPFGIPDGRQAADPGVLRRHFGLAQDDLVLLWGGGVYEWFDPETIIRALPQAGPAAHLVFLGGAHPSGSVSHQQRFSKMRELATQCGLLDRQVHLNAGWIEYERRYDYFAGADIGVIAHHPSLETRYSFRTRVLDYLWAGLPVLCTEGDHFAEVIRDRGLGAVARYESVDDWVALIRTYSDPQLRRATSGRVREFASTHRWSDVVAPLADLCESIEPAPDRALIRSGTLALLGHRLPSLAMRLNRAFKRGGFTALAAAAMRRIRYWSSH